MWVQLLRKIAGNFPLKQKLHTLPHSSSVSRYISQGILDYLGRLGQNWHSKHHR